jgi:hypothetical protein
MREEDKKIGCPCHPFGAHAHDRDGKWPEREPTGRWLGRPEREVKKPLLYGYGRPLEAEHDRTVRDVVARVVGDIEHRGGRILAVRSELQLKRVVGRRVAEESRYGFLRKEKQLQIAEEFGLKVVDGRIRIPDAEIVVERATGDIERAHVEVASKHYHRQAIAVKRAAGFSVHRGAKRVMARKPEDGPDIVLGIIR